MTFEERQEQEAHHRKHVEVPHYRMHDGPWVLRPFWRLYYWFGDLRRAPSQTIRNKYRQWFVNDGLPF